MIPFKKLIQSRTFWTIAILIIVNALPSLKEYIPSDLFILLNSVLGALAIYFRVNARVAF